MMALAFMALAFQNNAHGLEKLPPTMQKLLTLNVVFPMPHYQTSSWLFWPGLHCLMHTQSHLHVRTSAHKQCDTGSGVAEVIFALSSGMGHTVH